MPFMITSQREDLLTRTLVTEPRVTRDTGEVAARDG